MYRGNIVPKDVSYAVGHIKTTRTIHFVDWCPTGFKCGITYQPVTTTSESEIFRATKSLCMLANSTSIS